MADKAIYRAVGRRKSSTAQVILTPGTGKIMIDEKPAMEFFPHATFVQDLMQPLAATGTEKEFDITVNVKGGGYAGQAGAIRLAIARALVESSEDYRKQLRAVGLLTRDARIKERKKYGLRGARRAPQFSKR